MKGASISQISLICRNRLPWASYLQNFPNLADFGGNSAPLLYTFSWDMGSADLFFTITVILGGCWLNRGFQFFFRHSQLKKFLEPLIKRQKNGSVQMNCFLDFLAAAVPNFSGLEGGYGSVWVVDARKYLLLLQVEVHMYTPTAHTDWFWTSCDPLVGYSPRVGDSCLRESH